MPKEKTGFSIEQHKKYGEMIQRSVRDLTTISTQIDTNYGRSTDISREAHKVVKAIHKLKSDMDDLLCKENPDKDHSEISHCYYDAAKSGRF